MTKPATRKDNPPTANPDPSNTLKIPSTSGVDRAALLAQSALRPNVRAAVTALSYSKPQFGDLDLTALLEELSAQTNAVQSGNMRGVEEMLIAQAHTLQALFHELARRAGLNMGEYLQAAETYLRLALKAQSQCRATIETLALIKNPPPVTFVRQANVAHGPQQVNNGAQPPTEASRARESENQPNKLLEQQHGQRWTAERCRRQSELIQRWKPWKKSTGPRTRKGRARVARNAYKGGTRTVLRGLARALRAQRDILDE